MGDKEGSATLTICFMAAFADGHPDAVERDEIERIAGGLPGGADLDFAAIYQDAVRRHRTLAEVAQDLEAPTARRRAYELAVGVCGADGPTSPAEKRFLEDLRHTLGLDTASAGEFTAQAEALAGAPLAPAGAPPTAAPDPEALDRSILHYAILTGALEIMPESLATMAIIPLQMKMVYEVGKRYGYELDRGHVKDLLGTLGVGLASQYVEQVGRKIVGGLLGALGGSVLGGLGRQATSSALAFATTYALGQVAKRYYAGGRTLDGATLRQTFQEMLAQARDLGRQHGADIEQKARSIDPRQIVSMVKGE
ncbi:MAG TPA: DUF533 domain-containing protein [Anaeromyxobacteraceae bacterium]|nr:DUF533 domain-containing protein [Anaeromyxobacteraceae bacterium]